MLSVSIDTFERWILPDLRVMRVGKAGDDSRFDARTMDRANSALPLSGDLEKFSR
jgi:hypothetical protein